MMPADERCDTCGRQFTYPISVSLAMTDSEVVVGERAMGRITVRNPSKGRTPPAIVHVQVGKGTGVFEIPALETGGEHTELFVVPTRHVGVIDISKHARLVLGEHTFQIPLAGPERILVVPTIPIGVGGMNDGLNPTSDDIFTTLHSPVPPPRPLPLPLPPPPPPPPPSPPATLIGHFDDLFAKGPSAYAHLFGDTVVASVVPTRPPSSPPRLQGFEFERLIGQGGSTDVFLYRQVFPPRRVAVKVLLSASEDAFRREVELSIAAEHPAILRVLHAGHTADGKKYLVTEFCARGTLADEYRNSPLAVEDAIDVGLRLADALSALHRAGVVHGDVKPGNIFRRADSSVALGDFSASANALDSTRTHTSDLSPWAAPESIGARGSTTQSDVYGLAATIFALFTGRAPVESRSSEVPGEDTLSRISGSPTLVRRTDVPEGLLQVLAAALSTEPVDRPATMMDFAKQLGEASLNTGATLERAPSIPDGDEMEAHRRRGADLAAAGRHQAAVKELEAAVAGFEALEHEDLAVTKMLLAESLISLENWTDAMRALDAVIESETDGTPTRVLARAETWRGICRTRFGWMEEGRGALMRGRELWSALGDTTQVAEVDLELAWIDAASFRFAAASHRLDGAARTATEVADADMLARIGLLRGEVIRELGRRAASLEALNDARSHFDLANDRSSLAAVEFQLGKTLSQLGRWDEARAMFQSAGAYYDGQNDHAKVAECMFEVGDNYVAVNRIERAIQFYTHVRSTLDERRMTDRVAECDRRMASIFATIGDDAQAEAYFARARSVSEKAGLPRGVAECDIGIAEIRGRAGFFEEGDALFARALAAYRDAGLDVEAARSELRRAAMWSIGSTHRDPTKQRVMRRRAVSHALPAALYVDAVRHQLGQSDERRHWLLNVAAELREQAFRLTHESKDPRLLAELIMDARSTGTLVLTTPAGASEKAERDVSVPVDDLGRLAFAASSTVLRMLGSEGMRLEPGPLIFTPNGEIALRSSLVAIKSRFGLGVRSPTAVEL